MDSRCFLGFFLLLLIYFALVPAEVNGSVLKMRGGTSSVQFDPTSVTQLSWRPRAFIYKGFLSSEECDHLIILDVVADIEARIAAWTFLPVENGEALQMLHYQHGQKYEQHFDYFYDKVNLERGGHRISTV
ncbi:hypothetical protein Gotri_006804, partial [Gossypium trilobum]|nr:hypothetical protein [Gossypium trilobum]